MLIPFVLTLRKVCLLHNNNVANLIQHFACSVRVLAACPRFAEADASSRGLKRATAMFMSVHEAGTS